MCMYVCILLSMHLFSGKHLFVKLLRMARKPMFKQVCGAHVLWNACMNVFAHVN